jgi:glyoxylase-like metal-dependent hydrolase (beta-lactamase superfamily II)
MKLPAAIKAAGYDIKDVKAIIMGHLHLDHAGELEHFIGSNIPIYVHEEEFAYACWAVGTGADAAAYLASYMDLGRLNWVTFTDEHFDLCQGITLHHAPGHTPGLCVMQINLEKDGTFIWTTDHYHVAEHHDVGCPQGWLMRDQRAWVKTHGMIGNLERLFKARLILGHDKPVAEKLMR